MLCRNGGNHGTHFWFRENTGNASLARIEREARRVQTAESLKEMSAAALCGRGRLMRSQY